MRTDVFLKVEVDVADKKETEKIASEIVRAVRRIYAVRGAEVTHILERE